MKNKNSNNLAIGLIVAGCLFGLLLYIKRNLGDIASIAFLFYLLGILTAIICVSLGSQMNDQGQRAFIQGLAQMKSVLAPTMREDAKTAGMIDRLNIKASMATTQEDPEETTFFNQFQGHR